MTRRTLETLETFKFIELLSVIQMVVIQKNVFVFSKKDFYKLFFKINGRAN
jgi:hypothetical protein